MVIGDHFGGGDHFDGGDHFGGGTGGPVYPHPIIRRGGGLKNDNSKPCGFGLTMRWGPRIPRISNSRCINKDFDSKKILCELIPRGKKLLPMKINAIFNDSQLKKAAK